ncbi:MAG: hypothetical protein NZ602_04115 [Thermoguttaceae bacterium]|nr:hypothetical protein [Thermoguttaceae bacterium]MDW8038337.1 hypothetical protein [Thermoguttaceae bacterium]
MYQIDFLPEDYRHRRAARRRQAHRLLALGVSVAVLGISSALLYLQQRELEEQLALARPNHCALSAQQKQFNMLQKYLETTRSMAELVCYLRHPWPRTQILAELLTPLPETVRLEQMTIDRHASEQLSNQRPMSRSEQEAEKARLAAMPPPSRDLYRLRQECEPMQTVVRLHGVTVDLAALHQYLAALEKANLFTKVYLITLEKDQDTDQQALRFQVQLMVRPGYGQAGGPNASVKSAPTGGPPALPKHTNQTHLPSAFPSSKTFDFSKSLPFWSQRLFPNRLLTAVLVLQGFKPSENSTANLEISPFTAKERV